MKYVSLAIGGSGVINSRTTTFQYEEEGKRKNWIPGGRKVGGCKSEKVLVPLSFLRLFLMPSYVNAIK